jgi:hypothetical protein
MSSQTISTSALKYENVYPTTSDNKIPTAGGSLKKGLDHLTRLLEGRVDRQVLDAQVRAYNNANVVSKKVRFT